MHMSHRRPHCPLATPLLLALIIVGCGGGTASTPTSSARSTPLHNQAASTASVNEWARAKLNCPVEGWERWALARRSIADPNDLAYT